MSSTTKSVAPGKSAITISYSKPGTQPPIYLAGSFFNWQPQEMEHTVDEQEEYKFTKQVEVEEGQEYQYKFRVGDGDWWLLNEDEPTVTDDMGNRNNLLTVPTRKEAAVINNTTEKVIPDITLVETQAPNEDMNKLQDPDAEPKRRGDKDSSKTSIAENATTTGDAENLHSQNMNSEETTENESGGFDIAETEPMVDFANRLQAQDIETGAARSCSNTSEIARTAAEVADSAAILDQGAPTPPISDEEAGRTGYRRMSHTPIPEVAETAAEVADSAAIVDNENMLNIEIPAVPRFFDDDLPGSPHSGTATPPEDKVPLFAHECIQLPPGGFETGIPPRRESVKSKLSIQESSFDYEDPSLEEFPSTREAILEKLRVFQSRLAEDETFVEGIPPSPVIGAKRNSDNVEIPSNSPGLPITQCSPSLGSIPEDGEDGHPKDLLSSLPEGTNLNLSNGEPNLSRDASFEEEVLAQEARPTVVVHEVPESPPSQEIEVTETRTINDQISMDGTYVEPVTVKLPTTPFIHDISIQPDNEEPQVKKIITPDEGPNITFQPPTPGSNLKTIATDPFSSPIGTAKATAIEEQNGRAQVISRKPTSTSTERPRTPSSVRSAGKDPKSRNFLRVFWRVVFVEWIGGFIMRLCGGSRQKALLAIPALLLIALVPAVYLYL